MFPGTAYADSKPYSDTLTGTLGLNLVPSARMHETGTITGGVSMLDPYLHTYLGFQLAEPLFVSIRQSAETGSFGTDAERMYPGVDMKLRLLEEKNYRPEIALGLQSAIGHKRMAGEYLAISKRYNDFDFTLGMGWGRFGTNGFINNPLGFLSHFDKSRPVDGEMPNEPSDWFTGTQAGVFGGMQYFTPIEGLSLKLDYGADSFSAEQSALSYDEPALWSVGAVYKPFDGMDMSLAALGTDKIMGRVSFQLHPSKWKTDYDTRNYTPMRTTRTDAPQPVQMQKAAKDEGIILHDTIVRNRTASATIDLNPSLSAPLQYGVAAKNMADNAGPDVEEIRISPFIMNLRGPSVKILRRDVERALAQHNGSAPEIWRNTEFEAGAFHETQKKRMGFFAPWRLLETDILLDNKISLSEEDTGLLYRTSVLASMRAPVAHGALTSGTAVRINLDDNLEKLEKTRAYNPYGTRGNVDDFTGNRISLDQSWLGWTHSFTPELHLSLIGGYLEEMYAGYGGELLYRPFGPRYTLGIEGWHTLKRDPVTQSALGIAGESTFSGFANAWYDIPVIDATAKLKAGRFLAGDVGGTLALEKMFDNGVKLEGFVSISNNADFDQFGGTTHAYNGIRLTIPFYHGLGSRRVKTATRLEAAPFARDSAQTLENPMPLYELTEPFSYRHMEEHWNDITP